MAESDLILSVVYASHLEAFFRYLNSHNLSLVQIMLLPKDLNMSEMLS